MLVYLSREDIGVIQILIGNCDRDIFGLLELIFIFLKPNQILKVRNLFFCDIIHINLSIQRWSRWSLVFQIVFIRLEITFCIVSLLITIIIGGLRQVPLFFLFFDSGIDTYYKRILALTLSSSTMVLKIFLIVLVFFVGLVDRR